MQGGAGGAGGGGVLKKRAAEEGVVKEGAVGARLPRPPLLPEPQARSRMGVWIVGANALEEVSAPGVGPATHVAGRISPATHQSARVSRVLSLAWATNVSCQSQRPLQEVGPRRLHGHPEADTEADGGAAPGGRQAAADTEDDAGGVPICRGVVADDGRGELSGVVADDDNWPGRVAPALAMSPSLDGGTLPNIDA